MVWRGLGRPVDLYCENFDPLFQALRRCIRMTRFVDPSIEGELHKRATARRGPFIQPKR